MSDTRSDGRDGGGDGAVRPSDEDPGQARQKGDRALARQMTDTLPSQVDRPPENVLCWERGRLRQSLPRVAGRCMSFSAMTRFDDSLVGAVFRFYGLEVDVATAEAEILEDEGERIRFFPWFLWDWRAEEDAQTIGERFLAEAELQPHEALLVEALIRSYVGFHEVVGRSDVWVDLLDLATEKVRRIPDEALAQDVLVGQIVQARVVPVEPEGVALVDAIYLVLPSEARPAIQLELETMVADDPEAPPIEEILKAYASEMLDFADHLLDTLAQPPPTLNADGDELVLTHLSLTPTASEPLRERLGAGVADFERQRPGLWVWAPEGAPAGFVDLRGPGRGRVAANSPARHAALCEHLHHATGVPLTGLRTLEDFTRAVHRWVDAGGGDPWLAVDPEVRAAVVAWFASWARQWLEMPLAALGDRSPREAAREPGGRARVAAMVARFEHLLLGEIGAVGSVSLDVLRQELSLD